MQGELQHSFTLFFRLPSCRTASARLPYTRLAVNSRGSASFRTRVIVLLCCSPLPSRRGKRDKTHVRSVDTSDFAFDVSLWTKSGSYRWCRDSVPDASIAFPPLHADKQFQRSVLQCTDRRGNSPRIAGEQQITSCGQARASIVNRVDMIISAQAAASLLSFAMDSRRTCVAPMSQLLVAHNSAEQCSILTHKKPGPHITRT